MSEFNLSESPTREIIKRIRKTIKKLKAKRLGFSHPFTIFWDFRETTIRFNGMNLKIENDNWTGVTLYGSDDAIDTFMSVYNSL